MRRVRNCLGMDAFMREPVPPARMRKPVSPKPENSPRPSLLSAEEGVAATAAAESELPVEGCGRGLRMALLLLLTGKNAAVNGNSRRSLRLSNIILVGLRLACGQAFVCRNFWQVSASRELEPRRREQGVVSQEQEARTEESRSGEETLIHPP